MKVKDEKPIIIKSGSSDLRRQENKLCELVENNIEGGLKQNTTYAFCNSACNTVKLLTVNENKKIILTKIKSDKKIKWPSFVPNGEQGYTETLYGKEKKIFLNKIGYTDIN